LHRFLDNSSSSNHFWEKSTQNFTKITIDIAGVIFHKEPNYMWKTVSEGGTNRLIFLNAQTWWGAIKWIMKGNTQNCNKMQKKHCMEAFASLCEK